jgi:hypothetical protein
MRNKDRQYIPTMPARPAPSLWQRLRGAASAAVSAVRSAGARVAALVARKVTGARAALIRVARKAAIHRPWVLTRDGAKDAVSRTSGWCRTAWGRVIRPFLRVRVVALGIGAAVIGLATAPVATLTVLAGCGAVLVGLSRLIDHLEGSVHPSARVALHVIEVAAQVLRVVAYVAAGVAVLAISAVSAAFAVTEVLELVLRYLDVRLAASIATLVFFVLTASWGLVLAEIAWLALVHERKASSGAMRTDSGERQAIPLIRTDAERAWNGDETAHVVPGAPASTVTKFETLLKETQGTMGVSKDTTKCMGCDRDDRGPRYRIGSMPSLCDECFTYLVEDELVAAADRGEVSAEDVTAAVRNGIPVPAYVVIASGARLRSTRIDLDIEDVTCRTEARALSEQDPSKIHWAETGWWFDGRSNRRARRWHGFVSGRIAATVEYQHAKDVRGFYVVASDSSWDRGPFRKLETAQDAAADEISDRLRVEPQAATDVGMLLVGVAS